MNVGATDIHDEITFFSNYGQCVDIFAPGYNIISASPKTVSHAENKYVSMSGTSMACPHVTGTLALTMEKYPTATLDEIVKSLICDAAQSHLVINPYDTTSRNLLLQIPRSDMRGLENCPQNYQCQKDCANGGICLPTRVLQLPGEIIDPLVQLSIAENSTECFCEAGYSGASCEVATTSSCDRSSHKVTINLFDSYGDGWSFGRFSITNFEGRTVYGATDSLCEGPEDSRTYCLPEGKYVLSVDKGMFPQENQWNMCGIFGGAPYTGVFSVESKSHGSLFCKFICGDGDRPLESIILMSASDGWAGDFLLLFFLVIYLKVPFMPSTVRLESCCMEELLLKVKPLLIMYAFQGLNVRSCSFDLMVRILMISPMRCVDTLPTRMKYYKFVLITMDDVV